jgi:ABC-2 type transport system ATP-binding protein
LALTVMPVAVAVDNLSKAYGPVDAVRDVSFEVLEGETFGLLGPNGAGKTTTLECVLGLRDPDHGNIHICGIDARRSPRAAKAVLGAALQRTALQDKLTPREALALFGAFFQRRRGSAELLERFGLSDKADAPFDTLSGGQRQRLALALAFVNDPKVVVLDEPTAGLDPRARRELRDLLHSLREQRHTIVLASHDLHEVELLCDRVAIIDRGRIVASGAPKALVAAHEQPTLEDLFLTLTEAAAPDSERR